MTEQATQTGVGPGVDTGEANVPGPPVPGPTPSPLAAALAVVQEQLPRIAKTETGKVEKDGRLLYQYSYADLAGVSAAILPLLGANGLSFTAWPTLRGERFVLAYTLLHRDGERLDGEYPLKGGTAQAIGSEITYARRYCLCAVTGVAPDADDDDAAAAQAEQSRFRENQPAPGIPRDVAEGRERVKASWSVSFGWGDKAADECAAYYQRWPEHKAPSLWDADPAELRRYAAFLASLPPAVAGEDPANVPADGGQGPALVEGSPRPMQATQRAHIFALFKELKISAKREQLDTLGGIIGREVESRGELSEAEAELAIDVLKARKSSAGAEPVSGQVDTDPAGADRKGEPAAAGPEAPADPSDGEGA